MHLNEISGLPALKAAGQNSSSSTSQHKTHQNTGELLLEKSHREIRFPNHYVSYMQVFLFDQGRFVLTMNQNQNLQCWKKNPLNFGQDRLVVNLNGKGNSTLWYFIFKASFDFQLRAILHFPDFSASHWYQMLFNLGTLWLRKTFFQSYWTFIYICADILLEILCTVDTVYN